MARLSIPAGSVVPTGQIEQVTFWDRAVGGLLLGQVFEDTGTGPGDPYPNGFVPIAADNGNYPALIIVTDSPRAYRQLGWNTTRTLVDGTIETLDGTIGLDDLTQEVRDAIDAGGGGIPAEDFADVAFSGDYGDLANLPTIPELPGDVGSVYDGTRRWLGAAWELRPPGLPANVSAVGYSEGSNGSTRDIAAPPPDGAVEGDVWWQAF